MIKFLSRSIPRRILAALLSIYLVTYVATAVVVYSGVRASLLEADAAALNHLADLKYDELANAIGALGTDLAAWSQLEVMNDLMSGDIDKRITQTLEALKRSYRLGGELYAFDANGKLLATTRTGRAKRAGNTLPPQWRGDGNGLMLIGKERDPLDGSEDLVLAIPVFGTFGSRDRIGTLVLTLPWTAAEGLLFVGGSETVLVDKGRTQILGANPADVGARRDPRQLERGDQGNVVGRSTRPGGLIADWRVLVLQDSATAARPLRRVAIELLLLGISLGVPIVLLGRWLSRRLTAPIADLTRVVREIADTDRLDARVPVTSADELGSLAQSFNRMTDNLERTTYEREQFMHALAALNQTLEAKIAERTEELEAAVAAQQRLLGDISHEIKSPLARLSMALGLASRSAGAGRPRQFERMENEINNISALAGELLTLSSLDGTSAAPVFSRIDLLPLIERIVADAVYEKPNRRADVTFPAPHQPIAVMGNSDLLRRAVENVVRNALFYTSAGTPVEVRVATDDPALVRVEVRDRGPGVPEAALVHLFEPFYRVDEARARATGGTGIGLTICQRVLQLHAGSVQAKRNEPTGLIIEMIVPSLGAAGDSVGAMTASRKRTAGAEPRA